VLGVSSWLGSCRQETGIQYAIGGPYLVSSMDHVNMNRETTDTMIFRQSRSPVLVVPD
jgi:hypothetical protein